MSWFGQQVVQLPYPGGTEVCPPFFHFIIEGLLCTDPVPVLTGARGGVWVGQTQELSGSLEVG